MADQVTGFHDALVMAKLPRDEMRALIAVHNTLVAEKAEQPRVFEVGACISARFLASLMGLRQKRRAGRLLERLVDRGVLRVTFPAAGSRATAYTVDAIHAWRGVEWGITDAATRIVRNQIASGLVSAPKPAFVAHPRAPQTDVVRYARRPQIRASAVPTCATTEPVVPHLRAPQISGGDVGHTIPSELRTSSLPREEVSDHAQQVLGTMAKRFKPGTFLSAKRRAEVIRAVDTVGDAQPFVDALMRLPDEHHALNLADTVEAVAAAHGTEVFRAGRRPDPPPIDPLPELDDDERQHGIEQVRAMRAALQGGGAAACETVEAGGDQ